MWSALGKIWARILGRDQQNEEQFLLPEGIDKLTEDYTHTQELEKTGGPVTAREAFELAADVVYDFDADSRLTKLESRGVLDAKGRAGQWRFSFHLPTRWGQAYFYFNTNPGSESLRVELKPFVARGSAMDKMMQEGRSGFVEQQWKVELERNPSLPRTFTDSDRVMQRWVSNGGDLKALSSSAVLRAFTPPLGKARWDLLESSGAKKSLCSVPIE